MPSLIEVPLLRNCARLCGSLGLDFIELNMNLPYFQPACLDTYELDRLAKLHNIYYTLHLDENLNPCDFNRDVANAYISAVLSTIEKAARLGVPVINMHLAAGVYFTLPDRRVYLFEQYRDIYLKSLVTFRDLCGKAAANAGVTICVENCSGWEEHQREAVNTLLEHPAFGLTYDVGHDHAAGGRDAEFILSRAHRLRHMHLHDAEGKQDHLPTGTGGIDIADRLSLAETQGCRVVVETKTVEGLRQSVRYLRKHGFMDG